MILLIFLISWLGFTQTNCDVLLERIQESVRVIDTSHIDFSDLNSAYKALKTQSLTFREVYINRSKFKRSMNESEIASIRSAYSLAYLDDENVQVFYVNSIEKLLGGLDDMYRLVIANGYNLPDLENDIVNQVSEALWYFNGKTSHIDSYDESSLSFYDSYKTFSDEQVKELVSFFKNETDEFSDSELRNISFFLERTRSDGIDKRKYCCVSPGGCLMCPNNIKLKIIERKKSRPN